VYQTQDTLGCSLAVSCACELNLLREMEFSVMRFIVICLLQTKHLINGYHLKVIYEETKKLTFLTGFVCFLRKVSPEITDFTYVVKDIIFSSVEDRVYYSPFSIVVGCSAGAAVAAAEVVAAGDPEVLGANLLAACGKKV